MKRTLRAIGRWLSRLVPPRFESRRDRLSDEADQLAWVQQFRGGM